MRVNDLEGKLQCLNHLVTVDTTYLPIILYSGTWYALTTFSHRSIFIVDAVNLRLRDLYNYDARLKSKEISSSISPSHPPHLSLALGFNCDVSSEPCVV